MEIKVIMSLISSLFLGASGHLLLKEGVNRAGGVGLMTIFHPTVIIGVACFFLSMVSYLPFLASRPVAQAVPVAGITYTLVALGSGFIYGQWLTPIQWCGVLLVGLGVWCLGR